MNDLPNKEELDRLQAISDAADLGKNFHVGRIPENEEPDTCIIGSSCNFWARVVGIKGHPAEPRAFRLAVGAEELPRLIAGNRCRLELAEENYKLREQLEAAEKQSQKFVDLLFDLVPGLKKWVEIMVKETQAKEGK